MSERTVVLVAEQIQCANWRCFWEVWLVPSERLTPELERGLEQTEFWALDRAKNAVKALSVWIGSGEFGESRQEVINWAKEQATQKGLSIASEVELPWEDD